MDGWLPKKKEDLCPPPEFAVPVEVVSSVRLQYGTEKLRTIGDLVELQFLFLLRVGEYTFPINKKRITRTVQFRRKDVVFYKGVRKLGHEEGLATLLTADGVTLMLENQKNGFCGSILHQHKNHWDLNPVACLARLITRLLQINDDPEAPLCQYCAKCGRRWEVKHVTAPHILKEVNKALRYAGLVNRGLDIDRVGTHSLRSGGAMDMILNRVSETVVKKLGRWGGEIFQTYIHTQIMSLSNNVSTLMVQPIANFFHVGG